MVEYFEQIGGNLESFENKFETTSKYYKRFLKNL